MKEECDRCSEVNELKCQAGFTAYRGTSEMVIGIIGLMEIAHTLHIPCYRGYLDLGVFFMSVPRVVAWESEKHSGMDARVRGILMEMHTNLFTQYDTVCYGLAKETAVENGLGQGCLLAPTRAKNVLKALQQALQQHCPGFVAPGWGEGVGVLQFWFADDGAFCTNSFEALQLVFEVSQLWCYVCNMTLAIKESGTKSAWTGVAFTTGAAHDAPEKELKLMDDRVIPKLHFRAPYPYLGFELTMVPSFSHQWSKLAKNVKLLMGMLRRMKLSGETARRCAFAMKKGLTTYSGFGVFVPWAVASSIEHHAKVLQDEASSTHRSTPKLQDHATEAAGGRGREHTWQHTGAALLTSIQQSLHSRQDTPAAIVMPAVYALTCWRLGCREPPLSWRPLHLQGKLSDNHLVEGYLQLLLSIPEWRGNSLFN